MRQKVLTVVGMHRSGTSAVTRVLNLLGAGLPALLNPPTPDNELGFWEPLDIVKIHEDILASAGSWWDDHRAFPSSWYGTPVAQAFEDQIVSFLQRESSSHRLLVVKDPRICRLFPLWLRCLERAGVEPLFVLPVRNPLEVAMSLGKRDGFSESDSLGLWLRHFLEAERGSRAIRRSVVSYEHLLSDWRSVTVKVASDLDIQWPRPIEEAAPDIEAFLSGRHRHFLIDPQALFERRDIPTEVKTAYALAMAMAEGGNGEPAEFDAIYGNLDELLRTLGLDEKVRLRENIAHLTDELQRTCDELQRTRDALSGVLDSRSWRWTKLLRRITSNVRRLVRE